MSEIWKVACGTEGLYEVSNFGRVRRTGGQVLKASNPRHSREYPAVMLRHGGSRRRVAVHRLVALNFLSLPPCPNAQVRHKDGNHLNPRWDNLEWGSAKDNASDREAHGRTARGPRPNRRGKGTGASNANYRVTPEMKAKACELVDRGMTQRQAAEAVGITQKSVWQALRARAAAQVSA